MLRGERSILVIASYVYLLHYRERNNTSFRSCHTFLSVSRPLKVKYIYKETHCGSCPSKLPMSIKTIELVKKIENQSFSPSLWIKLCSPVHRGRLRHLRQPWRKDILSRIVNFTTKEDSELGRCRQTFRHPPGGNTYGKIRARGEERDVYCL